MPLRPALGRQPRRMARRGAGWWLVRWSGAVLAAAVLLPAVFDARDGFGQAAAFFAFCAALAWWVAVVEVVRSDLASYTIPDGASFAIAALGIAATAGGAWLAGDGVVAAVEAAVATGAAAFAVFWLTAVAFRRWGRDALGFGDVKLAGACAVWLSPGDAAAALELAALGAIGVLLLGRRGGGRVVDTAVPFGAFLAPAAWIVHLWAPALRSLWDLGS